MTTLFIKGGTVVNADRASKADVLCIDGLIAAVGATSIMGLMMLAAGPGSILGMEAQGPDAEAALAALIALVKDGFGEECMS